MFLPAVKIGIKKDKIPVLLRESCHHKLIIAQHILSYKHFFLLHAVISRTIIMKSIIFLYMPYRQSVLTLKSEHLSADDEYTVHIFIIVQKKREPLSSRSFCKIRIKSARRVRTSFFHLQAADRLPYRPRSRFRSRSSKTLDLQKPIPW